MRPRSSEAGRYQWVALFFPDLISGPFQHGLVFVFAVSAALGVIAAIVSLMRGSSKPPAETVVTVTPAAEARL